MSSNENPLAKKRHIDLMCNICKRNNTRCDGGEMPRNECSMCVANASKCTYGETAKKRGPFKGPGYVKRLENRIEKLESFLRKILRITNEKTLEDLLEAFERDGWSINTTSTTPIQQTPSSHIASTLTQAVSARALGDNSNNDQFPAAGDDADEMTQGMSKLSVEEPRFLGKASSAGLIATALEVKAAYAGSSSPQPRRPEFWSVHPWEDPAEEVGRVNYTFPPPDLLTSLINHYFTSVNLFLPLLHRPTFERSVASGLHLTDDGFAATLLLVCALGSRYSNDERVKLDGVDNWQSSGWKWFDQVHAHRRSYRERASLYDLQFHCLAFQYLQGTSVPHYSWIMVGIGIRQAQDAGVHRRKQRMTIEDELWKRAFWVLVSLDLKTSVSLGQPSAIQDEDFDLDFPVECDDEYWFTSENDPEVFFRQPPDKPSLITAFVLSLKLNKVLAVLMRTIYSLNKNKALLSLVGRDWEQQIVSDLDSTLNQWVDSIPDHLRWDPNRKNAQFFDQSASLYSFYYHVQILVHRLFIPSPNKPSRTTFPSLAICTNAARACSHVLDAQNRRGIGMLPHLEITALTAATVLLLNMWCGKTFGLRTDPNKEMLDVGRCMDALKGCESRWNSCGRIRDIVRQLASAGDLPLPPSPAPVSNKRKRDAENPASQPTSSPYGSLDPSTSASRPYSSPAAPRKVQGARWVNQHQQQVPQLPVYSTELGRSPSSTFSFGGSLSLDEPGGFHSSPSSFGGFSSLDWMQNESTAPFNIDNSTFRQQPTFAGDLGLAGPSPAAPSPLAYPGVVSGMAFHATAPGMQGHGSSGWSASASDAFVFPPLQSHADDPSPTSFSSGDAAFLNTPDFWAASGLPASVPYTDNMTGSSAGPGMDRDPQALLSNDMSLMWSNLPSVLELDYWGTYLASMSNITHSFQSDLPESGATGHEP